MTQATARGGDAQLKKLRHALLLKEFRVIAEQENHLEFRRRAYMMRDDWPMAGDRAPRRQPVRYPLLPVHSLGLDRGPGVLDAAGAAVCRYSSRGTGAGVGGGDGRPGDPQAKIRLPAQREILAGGVVPALERDHGTFAAGSVRAPGGDRSAVLGAGGKPWRVVELTQPRRIQHGDALAFDGDQSGLA